MVNAIPRFLKVLPKLYLTFGLIGIFHQGWAQSQFNDPRVQTALRKLKQEPSIKEVHRAALKFYNAEPETIASMRTRAAWKSILPDVHVRYRQSGNNVDINKYDFIQGIPDRDYLLGQDESFGNVNEVQISGSWSLSRLMFNPEVLDVASLAALQEGVLKEVTRLYYTRRRLQIDLILSNPKDPGTRMSKELRIEQLTATLDALTNNLLSRHMEATKKVTSFGMTPGAAPMKRQGGQSW